MWQKVKDRVSISPLNLNPNMEPGRREVIGAKVLHLGLRMNNPTVVVISDSSLNEIIEYFRPVQLRNHCAGVTTHVVRLKLFRLKAEGAGRG